MSVIEFAPPDNAIEVAYSEAEPEKDLHTTQFAVKIDLRENRLT